MLSLQIHAQHRLQVTDDSSVIRLSDHFRLLYEDGQRLSLKDVIAAKEQFTWARGSNPNYGFSENGLWLYTSFTNLTNEQYWVFDIGFSQLDEVDFYLLSDGEVIAFSEQGKYSNKRSSRLPAMQAELPFASSLELFIRIQSSSSSLVAPVDLQPEDSHTRAVLFDNLMWGLFYGGLIILAIYNLVLYFGVKEKSLLAYVGYIITVVFWQFVWGGHMPLMLPASAAVWLGSHIDLIFVLIGIGSGIFTLSFLDARQTAPNAYPFIKTFIAALALLGLLSVSELLPSMWQNGLVYVAGILAISSYIWAGFESYLNRFHAARYFIFAWGMLALGALIGMFSLLGILPSNGFTTYCFQVGVFLESGLFSLALMDKTRGQLEIEIEQATNDLRNNMELIEEQNARLDIARKDAIKASNVKSQFLANMSHEIRTPLNAILGFSKELTQLSLPPEKQEQIRIINAAADNLLTIVNDVLDFSKIEAGKLQVNNQPFSPNKLLEELVTLMSKSAHLKQLEFIFDLEPLPDKLIGDIFRIKQVLNNLLSNAIKFTPSGHICLHASGRELEHGMYELVLDVEDTGIGISDKDRKKLFSAFSQVDDALSRSYQGTGLGLVICQELVKLMRGRLQLHSAPGQGSRFSISLRTNLLSNKRYLSPQPDWQDKQIVIYDPYPFTRKTTATMLTLLGANVTSVDSLQYLQTLDKEFDFLFATLPVSQLAQREDTLQVISRFPAKKRIMLYSGPEPFSQSPHYEQYFSAQMRMPLTPHKIAGLLRAPRQSSQDELRRRLENLPTAEVLAVDDMDMNLRLLKTWLSRSPLNLTLAYSGQEAVSLCEKQEFDLILMDVQMPNMDGLQASKLIRRTDYNLGTPIIAVTAHAFKEEQERLLSSGMDDYLPKPIDLSDLVELIQRWCQPQQPALTVLPTLDWQEALRRAHQDSHAAYELLTEFVRQLPGLITEIEMLWYSKDVIGTQATVHKLHGACCYTGVPKLQHLCGEIESALKRDDIETAAEYLPALVQESNVVITEGHQLLGQAALHS
ncbi:hybrid sensor histidine kinase/response regulator [Aestuariibacter salexigens]|uniref:hybrid sensor histidine kinase/response regulator n=1 Tax=Aestuariibacter salexigens TaxID=226010 RepID=UPI0003FDAAF9|nr:hybrid sensor histidine kinase/response regulator [Aestuariibacter salexigens]